MYQALARQTEMSSWGLDLSKSPASMLGSNFGQGLIYAGLVVILGLLYFYQQRMVAARASISPTMSESQQKLMQYLPVVFAVFQIFFLLALVIYYIIQSIIRIFVQFYIRDGFTLMTNRWSPSPSRKREGRELSEKDSGGGGLIARAKRELEDATGASSEKKSTDSGGTRPSPKGSNSRTNGGSKSNKGRPQSSKNSQRRDLGRPGGQRKR